MSTPPDPIPLRPDSSGPEGFASAEDAQRLRLLGAALFASGCVVSTERLTAQLPNVSPDELPAFMAQLDHRLAPVGLSVRRAAKGWDLVTAPDLADRLRDSQDRPREVGPAALETLSVIAHQQPCTRADIARMRGTEVGSETMAALQAAGWIAVKPGRKGPGGASLWVTTPAFLQDFCLSSLDDLTERF